MRSKADVLLVTVTRVESSAVVQAIRDLTGFQPQPLALADRIYHDLGEINGARVYMTLSEMGAGGLGASQQAVQKGIEALDPSAVMLVGVAFGIHEQKQAIGDILVARQLCLYDLQRVGKDRIVPRGDKPHASARLMNYLRSADIYWQGAPVHFGLMLTGEKLVDNVDYRDQVTQFDPEALGGEMEGAGLYVACQDSKVDWIVVKAICDWADGNKAQDQKERQALAARNAASFVLFALQRIQLKREPQRMPLAERLPIQGSIDGQSKAPSSTLPSQPYFFGRDKELQVLADAISPEARTWGALIDGPGGIGKTALALRAGHLASAKRFPLKIFLSAKVRELTPAGEQSLQDFMLPNYMALLAELARELGEDEIARSEPNERANAVRRALSDKQALIVIDNIETFAEVERYRLYQFLSRLPASCKAIITSRYRADIDARVIRLDRLERSDAFALLAELAETNRYMNQATEQERDNLYGVTNGNPLLMKWVVGQLGRPGSHCRTIAEACAFLRAAPPENDPLEYVFGNLLDTFTLSETAVLAGLAHFTQPANVEWVASVAGLAQPVARTALEDLNDRALLIGDEGAQTFLLPPLAAHFLHRRRPEAVAQTGDRLTDRVLALILANGFSNYENFPILEAAWPEIMDALPLFIQGENSRLQQVGQGLQNFLHISGRWDERVKLSLQAEEKAIAAHDFDRAGWRAYDAGWVHYLRQEADEVFACAARCESHWQMARTGAFEKGIVLRLRGLAYRLGKNYPAATEAFKEQLRLRRSIDTESKEVANALNDLAGIEHLSGHHDDAERNYREALWIATKNDDRSRISVYIGNLAELALDRHNWSDAEELARAALAAAEAIGRQEIIASNCSRLAKALARLDRPQEGIAFAHRAVDILTKLRMPDEMENAQAALEECEQSGQPQSVSANLGYFRGMHIPQSDELTEPGSE